MFALQLVQLRHGAHNVQMVPDRVSGDAGIEYFALDGCLYQSYAPEEFSDVAKAASAMKAKASRDLKKLFKYSKDIQGILGDLQIRRWVLLCPFLDNKDVVAFIRKKGDETKSLGIGFLADDFRALVHSQEDFTSELAELRQRSLGPALQIEHPTTEDVEKASSMSLASRMEEKLKRAFPSDSQQDIHQKKANYVRAHLTRENALQTLKLEHPAIWEKSISCLNVEEARLQMLGAGADAPVDQLKNSLTRIEDSLSLELPDLQKSVITEISLGTLSDWLIRCHLDFPEDEN